MVTKRVEECVDCGSKSVREITKPDRFQYGSGNKAITLVASITFCICNDCGFSWTDYRAEEVREKAVAAYLKSTT